MKIFLNCVSKNAPIFFAVFPIPSFRGRKSSEIVLLMLLQNWNKYTAKIHSISTRIVRKITYFGTGRYWRVRLGSTFIVIIHTYSRQEIYSCIIHYSDSEERQKRALFFKLHGDIYGTPQQLKKKLLKIKNITRRKKGNKLMALRADYRSQNNSKTVYEKRAGYSAYLFFVVILFVNGEHCFRILQYLSLYTCGLATLHYSCTSHTNMRAQQTLGIVATCVLPLAPNAALTLPYKPYGKRLNSTKKLKQIAEYY